MSLHCCVEYVMCQHWWGPNCLVCSNSVNSVGDYGAKPLPFPLQAHKACRDRRETEVLADLLGHLVRVLLWLQALIVTSLSNIVYLTALMFNNLQHY